MKKNPFPTGKLDIQILRRLLQRYAITDDRVLIGPRIGEDAAAIDMGKKVLIVATDPITFATDEIGYYSVNVIDPSILLNACDNPDTHTPIFSSGSQDIRPTSMTSCLKSRTKLFEEPD